MVNDNNQYKFNRIYIKKTSLEVCSDLVVLNMVMTI